MTVPLPAQEIPVRRVTRARSLASALCAAAGLLAVTVMLGAVVALPDPGAPAGFLALVLIGLAAAGSVLSPRRARS